MMKTGGWRAPLAAAWLAAAPLAAQTADAADSAAGPSARLFTRRDLYVAGAFTAGALAMAPLDGTLAEALQDSSLQANRALRHGAAGARVLGFPGSMLISGGMFAAGRALGWPRMTDIGLHTFESIVLAEGVTFAAKGLAGRARPFVRPGHPVDYKLARGFGDDDHQSMPSGHTSAAFAAAAAATSEVGRRWPRRKTLAAATLYGAAGLVGVSRMYNNRHWASDVVVGAGIGAFSGWKVVGYTDAHPGNPVDRVLLGARVLPVGNGGVAIAWSSP